jgi:integrase/recombinase XerD
MLPLDYADKQKNNGGQTLRTALNNWLSYVGLRFSPATQQLYTIAARRLLESLPLDIAYNDVTPLHIEQFLQQTIATGCTKQTANTYLGAIRSFYRWAEHYCHLNNVTQSIKQLKSEQQQIRILTDGEYQQILTVAKGLDRIAIQFFANTGLRRDEFRSLRWSDFNGDFIRVLGKGNKLRQVPLNTVCKDIVARFSRDIEQPPFVYRFRYCTALYRLCAKIGQKTNIKFTPHSFRHYFATRLIRAGVPLTVVSRILGHSQTHTTERYYVHLCSDDLRVTDCLEF